jgi:hypothetical protein
MQEANQRLLTYSQSFFFSALPCLTLPPRRDGKAADGGRVAAAAATAARSRRGSLRRKSLRKDIQNCRDKRAPITGPDRFLPTDGIANGIGKGTAH